jgi:hypothetical protein
LVLSDESPWAAFVGRRLLAEGQAAFQQFQKHLEGLLEDASFQPATVQAREYFRYLPAVGLVPIAGGGADRTPGTADDAEDTTEGFSREQFFSGIQFTGPGLIEGRQLRSLLDNSYGVWAADLERGETHALYRVRENQEGVQSGNGDAPHPYVVFANHQTPSPENTRGAKRARGSARSALK